MFVAVVIPCRNEVLGLRATCASLGFGAGQTPPEHTDLFLIDNASGDGTLKLAGAIARECPADRVHVRQELELGFVPPRRAGNQLALQVAHARNIAPESVLVLQADADTIYAEGYVGAMHATASATAPGTVVQAIMEYPREFVEAYPAYLALCERAEQSVEWLLSDDPEQVVVDDKVVGYRLSDYLHWGGHAREFLSNGEEIHAETTRLYMKGRGYGARLQLAEDASAMHSVRRVLAEPAVDFATSGFPREASWVKRWRSLSSSIATIDDLFDPKNDAVVTVAVELRRKHILALFGLLPLHVAHAAGAKSRLEDDDRVPKLEVPKRDVSVLRMSPGVLIEDVLHALGLFWREGS